MDNKQLQDLGRNIIKACRGDKTNLQYIAGVVGYLMDEADYKMRYEGAKHALSEIMSDEIKVEPEDLTLENVKGEE